MIYFGTLATGDDTASLRFICIAVTVQIQKKNTSILCFPFDSLAM